MIMQFCDHFIVEHRVFQIGVHSQIGTYGKKFLLHLLMFFFFIAILLLLLDKAV